MEMSVLDSMFACRYRLFPRPRRRRCCGTTAAHARYVWNMAVEQHAHWPGPRGRAGYLEQCRQLTAGASGTRGWAKAPDGAAAGAARLRPGDGGVLRSGQPGRTAVVAQGRAARGIPHRGARAAVGCAPSVSRKMGEVWVPKAGWVRFRWSRAVPPGAKSYRVRMDRAGRWHVAFAVIPEPVPAQVTARWWALTGGWRSRRRCPRARCCTAALTGRERIRLRRLQRRLPERSGARTAAAGSGTRSPGCGPGRRTGARTGRRRPERTSSGVRRDPGRRPEDR